MNDASTPRPSAPGSRRGTAAVWKVSGVILTAVFLLVGAAFPAAAAELMRVTFIRHGQSAGNASGLIDTSTPGPVLTPTGQQQAQAVAGALGDKNFDGIYASTMVRTQLTAAPMSQYLRLPIQVLSGLQEIEAGVFENTPESEAQSGYGLYPLAWAIQGNRDLRIPGSIDGNEFDARMDAALTTIWENGDRNSVVFSHGGAIMFWTMMNAQNLTAAQKIDLLRTAPLSNTHYVVMEGNPEDGWTLMNWNGKLFNPEPTFFNELKRQVRTLTRQLGSSLAAVFESFASRNLATIATAINRAVVDATFSVAKFGRAMNAKIISDLNRIFHPAPAVTPAGARAAVVEETAAGGTPEPAQTVTVGHADGAGSGGEEAADDAAVEPSKLTVVPLTSDAVITDDVNTGSEATGVDSTGDSDAVGVIDEADARDAAEAQADAEAQDAAEDSTDAGSADERDSHGADASDGTVSGESDSGSGPVGTDSDSSAGGSQGRAAA